MAESEEHKFISSKFDEVLNSFSETKLIGVIESDRKRLDYSCIIERDCSRPLVSQVLWRHTEGIDKDLRILLHEREAIIKTYFVRDSVKHRLKIDEILLDYRSKVDTRKMLSGLRIFFLPPEFDADKSEDRLFMEKYISQQICNDLLFGVTFANLSSFEIGIFSGHGGPFGLKYAILDEITKNGLTHTPTFKERLGYKTTGTIREATTMLAATGLVKRFDNTVMLFPTIKGRMLLDLTRRILWEKKQNPKFAQTLKFSDELSTIVYHLMPDSIVAESDSNTNNEGTKLNTISQIILSAEYCKTHFGRDLLEGYDTPNPQFYSIYEWEKFYEETKKTPGLTREFFSEKNAFFFV